MLLSSVTISSLVWLSDRHLAAQEGSDLDHECVRMEHSLLLSKVNFEIDEILKDIEKLNDDDVKLERYLVLLSNLEGNENFCTLERRLRRLDLNTHLLALPASLAVAPYKGFTVEFLQPTFPTWSQIPKYVTIVDSGGAASAISILGKSNLQPNENLERLNRAGFLTSAKSRHNRFTTIATSTAIAPDIKYRRIYLTLQKYLARGYLSGEYNHLIMHAANNYLSAHKNIFFTINDYVSFDKLQFYVIESDPDHILSGFQCNCAFLPGTNVIICDSKFLKAILDWVKYGSDNNNHPAYIDAMNDSIGDFLMYWLIGHEIGHFVGHDSFDASFIPLSQEDPASPDKPSKPLKLMEQRADKYAIDGMPKSVAAVGYMAASFLIQDLVADAIEYSDREFTGSDKFVIKESLYGHPNLLARIFFLKDELGAVDTLLEDHQRRMLVSHRDGFKINGICKLVNG